MTNDSGSGKRKIVTYRIIRERKYAKIEEKILENLIELQKIQTDLAEKFENLAKQISELLSLFESAAKTFAAGEAKTQYEKDTEFLGKIDQLLEQNRAIAKGLTLMEDRVREKDDSSSKSYEGRPLPRF